MHSLQHEENVSVISPISYLFCCSFSPQFPLFLRESGSFRAKTRKLWHDYRYKPTTNARPQSGRGGFWGTGPPMLNIIQLAITIFLVTNPIGNAPAILALVKSFPIAKQRWILLREGIVSLCLALFFLFLGEGFLSLIEVRDYTVSFAGGILLVIVALDMIFAHHAHLVEKNNGQHEPFIVPIATPLLSGPGTLSIIMLLSHEVTYLFSLVIAVAISSLGVIGILLLSPLLLQKMGKRGLSILEQLMGLIVCLLGVQMIIDGINKLIGAKG